MILLLILLEAVSNQGSSALETIVNCYLIVKPLDAIKSGFLGLEVGIKGGNSL
jgi:hypothetical protein